MARTLTPQDAYTLINAIAKEAVGDESTITAVDTSSFVSVGETVLQTGVENTLNAISIVIGKTFMNVKPYKAKFGMIEETDTELFNTRIREISYYSKPAMESGAFNTDLYTNFAEGYDNGTNSGESTASMWKQNLPMPLELNFAGVSTWQDSITVLRNQLKIAFSNEATFNSFIAGILTEKGNDIEVQKEAIRRVALLNHMAGAYDMAIAGTAPTMAFNLTEGYNTKFGTSYTSEELRTTYFKSFLEYLVSTIKQFSTKFTYRTSLYHNPYTKTVNDVDYKILRHTDKTDQRLIMFNPLMVDAEAMVMPEIFNDEYLKIENYEAVDFWQNFNEPSKISITPAIPGENGQTDGDAVALDYVVGCLFDPWAVKVNNYLEDSLVTPVEARKRYYNIWYTFAKNCYNNFSMNFVLFYMADPAESDDADADADAEG